MASIWAARDEKLDCEVAVKFLDPELTKSTELVERFRREALAVSRIPSIHVVRVIDYGVTEHHEPYMILERLRGFDLDQLVRQQGRVPPAKVLHILKQACRALASAHDVGVIHRDIKPSNLFLTPDGDDYFVHVLDFGVARMTAEGRGSRNLTRPDELLGTLEYMCPELVLGSGQALDGRADVYALGVVTYEALTGTTPYPGESLGEIIMSLTQRPLVPASSLQPDVPPAFDAWLARALAIPRDDRFATAHEMGDALAVVERALAAGPASVGPAPSEAAVASPVPLPPAPPRPAAPPPPASPPPAAPSPPASPPPAAPSPPASPPPVSPPLASRPAVAPLPEVGGAPASRASSVRESVLGALGEKRKPVEQMLDRAGYELEAWTPEVLRNRTEPVHRILVRWVTETAGRAWRDHREITIIAVGAVAALVIVLLAFVVLG
jgi:serine/threonine-protein kinase